MTTPEPEVAANAPSEADESLTETSDEHAVTLVSSEHPQLLPFTREEIVIATAPHSVPRTPIAPRATRSSTRPTPQLIMVACGALFAFALVGLGAIGLLNTNSNLASQEARTPTATAQLPANVVPTLPSFGVAQATISFGYVGAPQFAAAGTSVPTNAGGSGTGSPNSAPIEVAQTCTGTDALPSVTIMLANQGTVDVEWWVDLTQVLPDGKTLWAGAAPPYDTLPAGQTSELQLLPDPGVCGELIGKTSAVAFQTIVEYAGGVGQFTLTDTITPPPPGTSTPTPTVPPTPIPTPVLTP